MATRLSQETLNTTALMHRVQKDFLHSVTGVGGTPGGANTFIQFNDAGVFNGIAGFSLDKVNVRVAIGAATPGYGLDVRTSLKTYSLHDSIILQPPQEKQWWYLKRVQEMRLQEHQNR
jgi:hypothetical protein